MTEVVVRLGNDGCVEELKANGHAGFSGRGGDIVCSAVTVLIRTAMEVLSRTDGIELESTVAERGRLAFRVRKGPAGSVELESRLRCVAEFLTSGIGSVSREFPENAVLRVKTENQAEA